MPRLTDPKFVYVPSFSTDLGARFRKMRTADAKAKRALVRAWTEAEAENAERDKVRSSVVPMRGRVK